MGWEEREIVPYETARLDAARAVVLAPHADDEVFGCGAAIASLRADGAAVTVVIVTDGAGDEPDPATRAEVAARRHAESRRALDALGGADVVALGFRDRGVREEPERLAAALRDVLGRTVPDLLFVPSPSEIHPDHRAVARGAIAALAALPAAGRVAFYEVSQPIRPNLLLDATAFVAAKDRAMEAFESQAGDREYANAVRGLNAYRRLTLPPAVRAAEAFYVVDVATLVDRNERASALRRLGPEIDPPER